jgi:hypothetical protein
MGYSVSLIKGEVIIQASRAEAALAAVRELDRRDDLKTGWSRNDDGVERRHWAFTNPDDVQAAHTLVDALRAFRFVPMTELDGELYGVELEGGTRNAGDELHLWTALAPFVESGGEMIWLGEDDALTRWSFDGRTLTVSAGRMVFD